MKINKNLVSEVLKLNICEAYIENNNLYFDMGLPLIQRINLYEFAFKCKEWALSKDYILSSNNYNNGGCCQVIQENGEECPECGECTTFEFIHSFTEIEAIIKATNSISLREDS